MRSSFLTAFVAAFSFLAVFATRDVSAQATRVVMTNLEGRNSAAAARVIAAGLEERGITVTRSSASVSSDAEAAAAAGDAQAVIGGSAASRGQRWTVNLWVRSASGATQGEVSRRVSGARGVRRVVAALAELLEGVGSGGGAAAPSTPEPEAEPEPEATQDEPEAPSEEPDEAPEEEAPERAEEEPRRASPPRSSDDTDDLPLSATVLVGAGIRTRAFELLAPDGLDAGYRAEPYFEITARAEGRFFDILFVRAAFGSSIGLESAREEARLGNVDTLFVHLLGDVGASYWFDDLIELGLAFGVGWDRYQLTFNELVPTAEYVNLRPAFVSGFRLIGPALVLSAEIGVRVPLSVGDLEALHGSDRRSIGADGVVRLGGVIDPGFTWSLEWGVRHYWLRFRRSPGRWVDGFDAGWHASGYAGWTF